LEAYALIYKFEDFELDSDRYELRRGGSAVPIEPQVFSLLVFLVTNQGRMVSKEEISEKIWGGRIVSEAALSSRIKSARQALGDDGKEQRLIRTVHGKGFRFVGSLIHEEDRPATTEGGSLAALPEHAGGYQVRHGSPVARPTIAVLPFDNMSGVASEEYFSDGITEDIITALSKHRWLGVVSRNTTFGYKGRVTNVRELAKELGIRYVVEGSTRRAKDRVRVTVQLIDADTGNHVWAERYDRNIEDIFAVQDQITETIVARLEPEIGAAERQRVKRIAHTDLQAWDCYHLGAWNLFKFTGEANQEAQRLLQLSRELDPSVGEAHAWWAYATVLGMVYWDTQPTPELLDAALAATNTALELDDQNAVFYALKARVQLARGEYDSAIAENEIAISLNPTLATAHCGLADSLAYEGRYDEALVGFKKAIDLSPNDPQRWAFLTYGALALIFQRNFEEAVVWANKASEIPNCQYWTAAHKAVALAYLGRQEEARKSIDTLMAQNRKFSVTYARQKLFYLKSPEQRQMYLEGLAMAGLSDR
jgi:TolB-like protein/Tfp pilus assembly protein PilF